MSALLPLVTVAVVTYNSESYISECIESILTQNYKNIEIVICDDCSQDRTWEIVQNFKDKYKCIRAYRNSSNLGEYPNRNQAISLAKGDYLIFIDGDDLLYPHGLDFMVQMARREPEVGAVLARPWSEKFVYPVKLLPRQFYLSVLLGEDVTAINFTQILFRTASLRKVGGLSLKYRTGDTYIQYRIALDYPVLLISDGLAWWRRRPGQASERLLRDHIGVLERVNYFKYLLSHNNCPLSSQEVKKAFVNLYGGFIRLTIYTALQGRPLLALRLLREAKIPLHAYRFAFIPSSRPYLSEVSGRNPIKGSIVQ